MIARTGLLALVLVTAVLLETVVLSDLLVAGYGPAIVALTVVAVGLASGPDAGARYGFAAGLFVDLLGGGLLGLHTTVLVLVGWTVGVVRPYLTGPPMVIRLLAGAVGSAAAVAGHGLLTFLLDPQAVTAADLVRATMVTGVYSGALAPFVAGPIAAMSQRLSARGTVR